MINTMLAMLAATVVYRLELTDEVPYIVGEDGVRRDVCIVDPSQYALMTGQVDKVWKALNESSEGRRMLHGRLVKQEIDDTTGVKTEIYNDGYRYHIAAKAKRIERKEKSSPSIQDVVRQSIRDKAISERHRKFREELEKRKASTNVTQVVVEHDAATGKDEIHE